MLTVKYFRDQHYSTLFNTRTGFFARVEDKGCHEPFWSRHGPEMMDIAITNWCDRGCQVCYRSSSPNGAHMPTDSYRTILRQASSMGVMQVALGGGNPNQHPDFCEILRSTRKDYGIVPSYTTNGRGLPEAVVEASERYCGAVAVSAYWPYRETWAAVRRLVRAGVKTNLHFVLNAETVTTAVRWLRDPPAELVGLNAIVFLNYKPVGRTTADAVTLNASPHIREFFRLACECAHPFRIGFDSCLASGIATYSQTDRAWFDGCEAARFSMYVSEGLVAYPCSFMEATVAGEPVTASNLLGIWQQSTAFESVRQSLRSPRCASCSKVDVCLGGCPVYPEVNLCRPSGACPVGASARGEC